MVSSNIRKGTRDEILSLVSSSSIISPYEILPDAQFYILEVNGRPVGYLVGKVIYGKRVNQCMPPASIFFIDVLEISKGYRRNGYGRILLESVRRDLSEYDIALLATRFSLAFWMKQLDAKGLDYFGKSRYIIFSKGIT